MYDALDLFFRFTLSHVPEKNEREKNSGLKFSPSLYIIGTRLLGVFG